MWFNTVRLIFGTILSKYLHYVILVITFILTSISLTMCYKRNSNKNNELEKEKQKGKLEEIIKNQEERNKEVIDNLKKDLEIKELEKIEVLNNKEKENESFNKFDKLNKDLEKLEREDKIYVTKEDTNEEDNEENIDLIKLTTPDFEVLPPVKNNKLDNIKQDIENKEIVNKEKINDNNIKNKKEDKIKLNIKKDKKIVIAKINKKKPSIKTKTIYKKAKYYKDDKKIAKEVIDNIWKGYNIVKKTTDEF